MINDSETRLIANTHSGGPWIIPGWDAYEVKLRIYYYIIFFCNWAITINMSAVVIIEKNTPPQTCSAKDESS